ncbi:LPXTG cell wall anchor domain-containing protein [Kitasatospora sp. NPDC057223]|uniref:LPXTG cell wall anchor domain-containing protein n=1 Tax=Kitasatospora sp. NPDC057223 TaxID=3346055 RepID=UPI0036327F53
MRTSRVLAAPAAAVMSLGLGLGLGLSLGLGAGAASAASPTIPDRPCHNGGTGFDLPTSWTGLDHSQVVRGAAPVESTVTIRNNSGHSVRNLDPLIIVGPESPIMGTTFTLETKVSGGDWKVAELSVLHLATRFSIGPQQLAEDETLTIQLRLTTHTDASVGNFKFDWTGGADWLDDDTDRFLTVAEIAEGTAVPGGKGTCTSFGTQVHIGFDVVDAPSSPSPTATPTVTPTATASATPTATATAGPGAAASTAPAPTVTATATVTVTAGPAASATTQAAHTGPELADTGDDTALPLALTGAGAIALGSALVALRRRRGSHS